MNPLVTLRVHDALLRARRDGQSSAECSLDLERSSVTVGIGKDAWSWEGHEFPYLENCRERTVYHWTGQSFEPVARFARSLIKLVPTEWGPPTFEIDGISARIGCDISLDFADCAIIASRRALGSSILLASEHTMPNT